MGRTSTHCSASKPNTRSLSAAIRLRTPCKATFTDVVGEERAFAGAKADDGRRPAPGGPSYRDWLRLSTMLIAAHAATENVNCGEALSVMEESELDELLPLVADRPPLRVDEGGACAWVKAGSGSTWSSSNMRTA